MVRAISQKILTSISFLAIIFLIHRLNVCVPTVLYGFLNDINSLFSESHLFLVFFIYDNNTAPTQMDLSWVKNGILNTAISYLAQMILLYQEFLFPVNFRLPNKYFLYL